jgi:glycine/D-amino acid oxidase-like deaminating enzyme
LKEVSKVRHDYLIVGQGIAGSLLALNLHARGKRVLVIDDGHVHSASKVAAGLINPITGRRHVLTWRFLEFWKFLLKDYPRWESLLEGTFFYQKPLLRFLKTAEEKNSFEQKYNSGDFEGIEIEYPGRTDSISGLLAEEVAYQLHQTGFVDQNEFILKVRKWLKQMGSLIEDTWIASDFRRDPVEVRWKEHRASRIIFTQGFQNDSNPYFKDLPFRHAKGELLELEGPVRDGLPILNRGKWLLPLSSGRYRAGATYELKAVDLSVTPEGKEETLNALGELVGWEFRLVGQAAGVRPALHDFKPVVGSHPWYPELIIFNGLGSKGSLQAPLLAKELVDHLEDGSELHPESDVNRFRKYL